MTPLRLIIAGSRTVDPTDEQITAGVVEVVRSALTLEVLRATLKTGEVGEVPEDAQIERDLARYVGEVICGKADGADLAGKRWAERRGIPVHEDPVTDADRAAHGVYLAPKARNHRMSARASHAVVFWDGRSGGSSDMAARMLLRRKPALVLRMERRASRQRARKSTTTDVF